MRWSRLKLSQQGDTIVEVLISAAVISLVLAGAYAITTHNVGTTQDTQEHSQAEQLVRTQVELLRAAAAKGPFVAGLQCFDMTTGAAITAATDCDVHSDGTPNASCTDAPCYQIRITPVTGLTTPNQVYQVVATWDSVHGANNRVSLTYAPVVAP